MLKKICQLLILLSTVSGFAQDIQIKGNLLDTAANLKMEGAVVTAIRVRDSTLASYTRTNKDGVFNLRVPIDTFRILFSYPNMGEKEIILVGTTQKLEYEFKDLVLPPKSIELQEIQIYGYSDPVFYKGDTLVYVADSFKVKPNAMVEDLLKKLPGIKVDKQGGIKAQGKDIDKVLVDGDEFFGSDPTMATKNLNASSIESVQIYDKENSNSNNEDGKDKVLDLKLKEEAKKGYFGKIDAASDGSKFYEGQALFNQFRKSRKISFFGLAGNTPNTRLNFQDIYKFELNNELNSHTDDNGSTYYYMDRNDGSGIPKTYRTGMYYSDKINKNTKLNLNYSFTESDLDFNKRSKSTYFLPDSNFSTTTKEFSSQRKQQHKIGFLIEKEIDSLNTIVLESKVNFNLEKNVLLQNLQFFDSEDSLSRDSRVNNFSNSKKTEAQNTLTWNKKFRKKDRKFSSKLLFNSVQSTAEGTLQSSNQISSSSDSLNQLKNNTSINTKIGSELNYTEPLSAKNSLQFQLANSMNMGKLDRQSTDFVNGEYSSPNVLFSNHFENTTYVNQFKSTYIFEVKKKKISLGANLKNINWANKNLDNDSVFKIQFNNILPFAGINFNFSDNSRLSINYALNTQQPSLSQLQPLVDNTNPNRISIGNLNLAQGINNSISGNFNSYKPISGNYSYLNFGLTHNSVAFGDSTSIDSLGITRSKTINIYNTKSYYFYYGMAKNFFDGMFIVNPGLNSNYNEGKNYLNGELNENSNLQAGASLALEFEEDDYDFSLTGDFTKNFPRSSLPSYQVNDYYTYSLGFDAEFRFPKEFTFEGEANYTKNQLLSNGFNNSFVIVNMSLNKQFLKTKNLSVGLEVKDLLNQQTNINRQVAGNIITDTNTNLIRRYFLVRLVYRFNNKGKKEDESNF